MIVPNSNHNSPKHSFEREGCHYPFVQDSTVVTQNFLDIANALLGDRYDPDLLLHYYAISRLMLPNRQKIGNAYNYYRSHYLGLEKDEYASRDLSLEKAFIKAMKGWWKMNLIDFLLQYEILHRASDDDSGFENGLVLQSFLSKAITGHCDDGEIQNATIINPSASFVSALSNVSLPDHVQITCCCLDKHIVQIYQSEPSLQQFRWVHISELSPSNSAEHILFFASTCKENTVKNFLDQIIICNNGDSSLNMQLVFPTSYFSPNRATSLRQYILTHWSCDHILVIDINATHIAPNKRCVLHLSNNQQKQIIPIQRADLVSFDDGRYLQTSSCYSLSFQTFTETTLQLHELYERVHQENAKTSSRGEATPYHFAQEIILFYTIESPYGEKFRVRACYRDFPTKKQKRGKRKSDFILSPTMDSKEEIQLFLDSLLGDTSLGKIIRATLRSRLGTTPISLKGFWYLHMSEIMKRPGYHHDFCVQLFHEIDSPSVPLFNIIVGKSNTDEIVSAVRAYVQTHHLSVTYERELLLQLKVIFDFAYVKGICPDRPLQELLSKRESRRDAYHALRESSVSKSLSNEHISALNQNTATMNNLRTRIVIALKKDAGLTGPEIGALTWSDFVHTPGINTYHLLISKKLGSSGTSPILFANPNRNRCAPLSSETSASLIELRNASLDKAVSMGFTEKDLSEFPVISKPDNPQQGLTKNQINRLSAAAVKQIGRAELKYLLPEGSHKAVTDLNKYGGDLLNAHYDDSIRKSVNIPAFESPQSGR